MRIKVSRDFFLIRCDKCEIWLSSEMKIRHNHFNVFFLLFFEVFGTFGGALVALNEFHCLQMPIKQPFR